MAPPEQPKAAEPPLAMVASAKPKDEPPPRDDSKALTSKLFILCFINYIHIYIYGVKIWTLINFDILFHFGRRMKWGGIYDFCYLIYKISPSWLHLWLLIDEACLIILIIDQPIISITI